MPRPSPSTRSTDCVTALSRTRNRLPDSELQNLLAALASILTGPPKGLPQVDPADAQVRAIDFQTIPYNQIGIEKSGESARKQILPD